MALTFYPAGRAVQRHGAAPVILVSSLIAVLGALGFVFFDSLGAYFVARFLMGAGSGGLWMAISLGVIERWPADSYKRLSGVMAAYSVGAVAGPALGAAGGIREPFLLYACLVVVGLLALPLVGAPHEHAPAFGSSREVLRTPGFLLASAAIVLVSVTLGVLDGNLPLHFSSELSQAGITGLYAVGALVAAGFSLAAAHVPVRPTILVGAAAMVGGVALAGAGSTVWVFGVSTVITAVGVGLDQTSAMGSLLDAVGPGRMILAMAVWSQVFALAYLVGPILGGVVAQTVGYAAIGLVPLGFGLVVLAAWIRLEPPC